MAARPFQNRRVPEVQAGIGILYPRYSTVAELLAAKPTGAAAETIGASAKFVAAAGGSALPAAAPAAAAAAAPAAAATPPAAAKGKKRPAAAAADAGATPATPGPATPNGTASAPAQAAAAPSKKQKGAGGDGAAATAAPVVSGGSNAQEAAQIRQLFGFAAQPAAPAPAPAPAPAGGFAFGFSAEQQAAAAEAAAAAAVAGGAAAAPQPHQEQQEQPKEQPLSKKAKKALAKQQAQQQEQQQKQQQEQLPPPPPQEPPAPTPAAPEPTTIPAATTSNDPVTEAKLARMALLDSADRDGYVPRRIYAGGMPFSWEEQEVRSYWEWCGEVESVDLMRFPDSGRFRGLAFVTFATQEGFEAALQCDGQPVEEGGRTTLRVDRCKAAAAAAASRKQQQQMQMQAQQQQGGQQPDAGSTPAPTQGNRAAPPPPSSDAAPASQLKPTGGANLAAKTPGYLVAYVGNVAFEASADDLKAHFEPHGATKVRLHTEKDTGRSKGYAHVHFSDEKGLDEAVASLDGADFFGRPLRVGYGQLKKPAA